MSKRGGESSTATPGGRIDAETLRGLEPSRRLAGRNKTKADILMFDTATGRIAVKDYGARAFWIRATLGRLLVARECAAYVAAGDVAGLAPFLGRLGPYALATGWVEGRPLAARGGERLDVAVFDRLDRILAACHARGVALGDLHHRDVLVEDGGEVRVVDLATAWVAGAGASAWRRRIFERLRAQDLVAAARLRARFTGIDEAEAMHGLDPDALRWHARGRRLKAIFDRLRLRR